MSIRKYLGYGLKVFMILALLMPMIVQSTQAAAQPQHGSIAATIAFAEPDGVFYPEYLDEPVDLTQEQLDSLMAGSAQTGRPGPGTPVSDTPVAGPPSGSETTPAGRSSMDVKGDPMLDSDIKGFRYKKLDSVLPSNSRSNVSEVSIDGAGKNLFATGNWWAARSTNGGNTWSYINPYSGMTQFCCDQIVMYDKSRNMLIWLRMGIPNTGWYYWIGASTDGGNSFTYWSFDAGADPGHSGYDLDYDYPHWALTHDHLYLSTNIFQEYDGFWWATRELKLPLDALRDGIGFGYSFWDDKIYFNHTPVQGALDTMYTATHISTSVIRVHEWQEDSGSIWFHNVTVPAWTNTNRGNAYCGYSDNWGGRTDDRVLAGWYRDGMHSKEDGVHAGESGGVVGFMWNVQEGGGFPYPYVEAVRINVNTWALATYPTISGFPGRPLWWWSSGCVLYPTVTVNSRGGIGLMVHGDLGDGKPAQYVALWDDYGPVPPGWNNNKVAFSSTYRPSDDKWGDYSTIRPYHPAGVTFIVGSHALRTQSACCKASIYFFIFGRARDKNSWKYWSDK